jgi:hypothetical protein
MEGPTQGFNLLEMSPNLHPRPSKGVPKYLELYARWLIPNLGLMGGQ